MDHLYNGERCVRCGVNIYDADLYDEEDETCPGESPTVVYTTDTVDGVESFYLWE